MYGVPSSWIPKSKTCTIPGSGMAALAFASWKNRWTTSSFVENRSWKSLIAARRPSSVCSAATSRSEPWRRRRSR
jgi:hypothetical protein